jgi:hypothetical protein
MLSGSSRAAKLVPVLFGAVMPCAFGGTTVFVVDPAGNAVPSEIVQMQPAPVRSLGQTDPNGRLALPRGCRAGALLRADPTSQEYYRNASSCDPSNRTVRIEVTPIAVVALLRFNMNSAVKAHNQAAVAQIAGQLADRTKYQDPRTAVHYENVFTVALARLYSSRFNTAAFWSSKAAQEFTPAEPSTPQAVWASVCKASDLIACRTDEKTHDILVIPSPKLQAIVSEDPKAPNVGVKTGLGGRHSNTYDWLKQYSGKDRHVFLIDSVPSKDLDAMKLPNQDHTG